MSKVVLDASAVLAILRKEPGAAVVLEHLSTAVISAVNYSEVITNLSRDNRLDDRAMIDLQNMLPRIVLFDDTLATTAGKLDETTRAKGLSLGDRACLALAKQLKVPALTADRAWNDLNIDVNVVLIRHIKE